jgi:tetratricopeptide (TPR) repeat protein
VIRLPNSNNRTLRPIGKTEAALAKLPYVITPRETNIISDRPQISWNAVSGAAYYIVKIDGINWEKKTDKTEIIYDGKTPLEAGMRYRIIIETDKEETSENDAIVGFTVSDEQTKKTVLEAVEKIQKQPLSPTEKELILAYLYRGYELYSDAINILEKPVNQGTSEITFYQLLGDTYLDIGLPQLARNIYQKGLELAIKAQNIPTQTTIRSGIKQADKLLGNNNP